jgi:hypothetical protein
VNIAHIIIKVIKVIKVITSIVKMSQSSLSEPSSEPSLPILPPTPFNLLVYTVFDIARKSLNFLVLILHYFHPISSRTLLDTVPPTVQLNFLQPGCIYAPKPQLISHKQASNYWTHYKHTHPEIYVIHNPNHAIPTKPQSSQTSSHASDIATLFTPRLPQPIEGSCVYETGGIRGRGGWVRWQ